MRPTLNSGSIQVMLFGLIPKSINIAMAIMPAGPPPITLHSKSLLAFFEFSLKTIRSRSISKLSSVFVSRDYKKINIKKK